MHYPQRVRETLLLAAIFERHPEFRGAVIAYGGTSEPTEDRPYTIEGGDVIMLSPEAVLVGDSERTRSATIELLAAKCFKFGRVQRVYEIPIPTERSFMHLDTVFNILDRGVVLWHAEVMDRLPHVNRYEPDSGAAGRAVRVAEERSIRQILADEFGGALTVVETAGGSRHFAAREQRSDGANAFSIAPRTAVCFERNELTNRALEQHGIRCLAIKDSELVRGLGGPRCMTMPLRRSGG
jgi:arginine deiminase